MHPVRDQGDVLGNRVSPDWTLSQIIARLEQALRDMPEPGPDAGAEAAHVVKAAQRTAHWSYQLDVWLDESGVYPEELREFRHSVAGLCGATSAGP